MKKKFLILTIMLLFAAFMGAMPLWAGEMDVLVNKLVEKGILTPYEAQILKAEAKEEAAKDLSLGKAATAPEWTQKIKIKGDVRFRTQGEWGKFNDAQNEVAHQRLRNRVRARIGLEGKVNEEVSGGILAVTGGGDPRSTNQTLDDNFETQNFNLDEYYIKWEPQVIKEIGDETIWFGKFKNPFVKSEVLWDSDICPGGMAVQYVSPTFQTEYLPPTSLFGNFGFLWLDELDHWQTDPLMWVYQAGINMDVIEDWGSKLNMALVYYDLSHIKMNNQYTRTGGAPRYSSQTNTTWTLDGVTTLWRYDYNLVDFIVRYDSKQFFDFKLGHGVYTDFIWNSDSGATKDFAWHVGGYVGDKSPKKPGQWKIWGEYRSIERDAVPDFLPDSDFYGFQTNGRPRAGGTNGHGFNGGVEYAIFNNTVLAFEYYYCVPINVESTLANSFGRQPYQLFQLDVRIKF